MADKLSVTIALEGGKEIQNQLADIGTAGQKAFLDIAKSAEKVGGFKNLKPEEITAKLKEMGNVGEASLKKIQTAVDSAVRIEKLTGAVKDLEGGFSRLNEAAKLFGLTLSKLSGIGVLTTLIESIRATMDAIRQADQAAINLGISISKYDQLRQIFEKMGFSAQAVSSGIETLKKNLDTLNVERVRQAFEQLQSTSGLGIGSEALKRLQDAAQGVGTAADHARVALVKLADQQRLKSLQTDLQGAEQAAERARAALARLSQVPSGTPGLAQEMKRTAADVANAELAVQRLKTAVDGFTPQAAPLTGVAAAFERLGIKAGDISERLPEVVAALSKLPDSAQRSSDAILLLGQSAGTQLIQMLHAGEATDGLGAKLQAQANAVNAFDQSLNKLADSWKRFVQSAEAGPLKSDIQDVTMLLNGLNNLLAPAKWTEWGNAAKQAFIDLFLPIGELEVKIAQLVASIPSWLGKLFSGGGGTPGETTPAPGMAGGGVVGGTGTGTSDSNLAWVSRGEHVMPARAVSQPGVLSLLETLRASGGSLRGIGRFATGGVVSMPALASASGGIGHLGTVDLRTDHGSVTMMASSSAVDQLSRLAVQKRITSTGRKPGFIG